MAGLDAFGTSLSRGDGESAETFTAIAHVTNVGGPSTSRSTLDVTAHDSADGWMEFVGSLKDGGDVSIDINYRPVDHDTIVDDYDDIEPRNYKIAFPDGSEITFAAILTSFEPAAPHDGKLSASCNYKISGKPTFENEGI